MFGKRRLLLGSVSTFAVLSLLATSGCALNFANPTRIDNGFLPLTPGTQFVLEGRADRGNGLKPHRVVTTVTDLTKVIDGVRTLVLLDQDFNAGKLVEEELFFQAQDNSGAVWNYGEYPEEYEGGKFAGAPNTWIPGIAGAKAGIHMLANPRKGAPEYSQGLAPAIDFADRAKVIQTGQQLCVRGTCYANVLVTQERDALDPAAGTQLKYYAPGVGNIRVGAAGDPEGEVLELVKIRHLCAGDLDKARAHALTLDRRGYRVSRDVYARTPRAAHTLSAPDC